MVRRGLKAMERSLKKMKQAREEFCKYTSQYKYLSEIGDKGMAKTWRGANKARENWIGPRRLDWISEEEEPPDEPPDEPPGQAPRDRYGEEVEVQGQEQEAPEPEKHKPSQGKVRKLTDYFRKLGGPKPSKAPKTPIKTPKTPPRDTHKSRGVKKTKRKGKIKMEEPQKKKMENSLRDFLKRPPNK